MARKKLYRRFTYASVTAMQMILRAYPDWDVLYKDFKSCKLQKSFKKLQ